MREPTLPRASRTAGVMCAWGGVAVLLALALPTRFASAQSTLSQLQADVSRIANGARPSVLTVIAQRTVVWPANARRAAQHRTMTRVGTGITMREDEVITTLSVVKDAEQLRVRTVNGLEAVATLLGVDRISNLAVLHVADLRLTPLRIASGSPSAVGDWVMTLGTSYGGEYTQSVGNVTYIERDPRMALIQLSNTAYPGNSGGAALNSSGDLVGMVQGDNVGRVDNMGAPGGASYILPMASVLPVYEELRQNHRVAYGWLGVSTSIVEVESESQAGLKIPLGALVESVVPGGPAERMGLKSGDLVVAFEGQRVEYPEQLARWVAASRPGSTVHLVWAREQVQMTGRVTLGQSPESAPAWATGPAADGSLAPSARMQEIERQIQQLNRELATLKSRSAPPAR